MVMGMVSDFVLGSYVPSSKPKTKSSDTPYCGERQRGGRKSRSRTKIRKMIRSKRKRRRRSKKRKRISGTTPQQHQAIAAKRDDATHSSRSHALRENAVVDAPASQRLRRTRRAWRTAFPRGPWERVLDPPRWFSARSVRYFLFMSNLGVSCIIHDSEEFPSPQPCAVTERTHTAVSPHAASSMLWMSASATSGEWPRMLDH